VDFYENAKKSGGQDPVRKAYADRVTWDGAEEEGSRNVTDASKG